ncbi:SpaH/EbpB family LPXTG-anchored major pilin [Streptococcus parasuis]|uniref:SpaH/EbpB family LPXTG-anchored major pilin n=1 Tax=Streptococcus parasuis TaxID=1501662 RepID=UPI002FD94A4F
MKKKNLFQVVISILTLLVVFIGPVRTVFAADDIVNVTINKRIFDEGKTPANKQNTGDVMRDFGGQFLNGSEFTVYNVSDEYYRLIKISGQDAANQNTTIDKIQKDAINKIQQDAASVVPEYAKEVGDGYAHAQKTAGEGQATFANLPLKNSDGHYNVYLFVETKTPNNVTVTKRAVPMVVAMPIYKLDVNQKPTDVINTNIQLYPKNETAKDTKEFINADDFSNVTIDGQNFANVTTGDILKYILTVNIPANIGDPNAVQSFKIHDKPSVGLALVTNEITVGTLTSGTLTSGTLTLGTDYNVLYAEGGFTVVLNLKSENVKALAGEKLQLTYNMKLTDEVNPDQLQSNKASVQINDDTEQQITPPTPVGTGGYKFTKKDAQTGKVLQNAKFVVTNKDQSKFATFTTNDNGDYVFTKWVDKIDDATKVVSDAKGSIRVIGLLNGDYVLKETDTPSSDYVILEDGIKFTVEHGIYGASHKEVKNIPKGLLPSTGGAGIILFVALGAAMVGLAGVYFTSRRKDS